MVHSASVVKGLTALSLLLRECEAFLLFLLPATAACLAAIRRGWRDVYLLGCLGLAALGTAGYLAFWLWFLSPIVGRVFSFLTPLACAGYAVFVWRRMNSTERKVLKLLALPSALVLAAGTLTISAGYLYGGTQKPLDTAQVRFSHRLPGDNEVPWLFVQQIRRGHVSKPMFIDWLSSDRPPLQTGMTLLQFPFMPGPRPLSYQISGVLLQCLWIFALWLFLSARNVTGFAMALSLGAVSFTGFTFVNSFYIWPKLLAAAYLIAASAMLLSKPLLLTMRIEPAVAFLAGALVALGLLAHGGVMFSALALIPLMLILHPATRVKGSVFALLGCLTFYLPWTLYQKFFDPPGNRLLKWHLAGVIKLDERSFGQTLRDSYRALSWQQILETRKTNAVTILDDQRVFWSNLKSLAAELPHDALTLSFTAEPFAHEIRGSQFFHFATALGFLVPGTFLLAAGVLRRHRSQVWRAAALCLVLALFTLIDWCFLMFLPFQAVIHQGSYAAVVFALAGSVLAMYAVSKILAITLSALNTVVNWLVYVVYSRPATNDPTVPAVFDGAELFVLLAAVAIFLLLLVRIARNEPGAQELVAGEMGVTPWPAEDLRS